MPELIRDPRHADHFETVRLNGQGVPPADSRWIDVAVLDMNHEWPNIGHDALVHVVLGAAKAFAEPLRSAGLGIRVLSFDVRRRLLLPRPGDQRFRLFVGTGGPGHLDPRKNDGRSPWSQGIVEDPSWETPLFRLFDDVLRDEETALIAVCHTFGLICRWAGIARPVLRGPDKGGKSSGMPQNVLSDSGAAHPWFSRFAAQLPDHRHFTVVDNRLFDLVAESRAGDGAISFESTPDGSAPAEAVTSIELARNRGGVMPRFFGVNHHPEIVDRELLMTVLEEKLASGEVTGEWYEERAATLRDEFTGERERQSRLTSEYMLQAPVRFHLARLIRQRREMLGLDGGFAGDAFPAPTAAQPS
jgi:hypothetical protein